MLRALYERTRELWRRALREETSAPKLGASVGLGVFVGCTPFIGFHFWIALVVAPLVRLSAVWAILGSRVSFFLTLPWIILAEVNVAHRLRTGQWASLLPRDAVAHAGEYLLDWSLGVVPVGCVLALVLGLSAYGVALQRERLRRPRPSRSPPTSSGSPP